MPQVFKVAVTPLQRFTLVKALKSPGAKTKGLPALKKRYNMKQALALHPILDEVNQTGKVSTAALRSETVSAFDVTQENAEEVKALVELVTLSDDDGDVLFPLLEALDKGETNGAADLAPLGEESWTPPQLKSVDSNTIQCEKCGHLQPLPDVDGPSK